MSGIINQFVPGETAFRLRIQHANLYEPDTTATCEKTAYDRYIQKERITRVGRKIIAAASGRKYRLSESNPNAEYLSEDSLYSPEYLLFPTHDAAADFIIKNVTIRHIRNLAQKLSVDGADKTRLKNIETILLAAVRKKP